jgi:putative flippase GtrA
MSTIKKELLRFLVAGFSAVATDMSAYYLLLLVLPPSYAKGISFMLGTIVAYLINKYWTFEQGKHSYSEMLRFAILYGTTLGCNVMTNKLVLNITALVWLAFLAATGVSTVLNFAGQKWWVFRAEYTKVNPNDNEKEI